MCRIVGLWDFSSTKNEQNKTFLSKMRDSLEHGGPDHGGIFSDTDTGLHLGHRRLSIIDLSAAGNQPFNWQQYSMVFNGEVYNYSDINKELTEYTFSSNSDTETILKAWNKWGEQAVHKFRGMFAFALYNKTEKKLSLVRDRLGVKPIFYYKKDNLFLFGSELKALLQHPNLDKTINQDAVALFLHQGYIPSPISIFKYVKKVQPGHILTINKNGDITEKPYWKAEDYYKKTIDYGSEQEWKNALEKELIESINYRMVADVPVGSFLSGGIDSSLVSAIIQKHSTKKLKTFTIGFDNPKYNEAGFAKEIANYIGSEHNELYINENHFEQEIEKLPFLFDEPNADASIIPTHLVSKFAKEQVKVSLSADGGDELFGGYTKYEITNNFYPKIKNIPAFGKQLISKFITNTPLEQLEKFPILKNYKNLEPKLLKFNNALKAKNQIDFFNIASTFLSKQEVQQLCGTTPNRISFQLPKIDNDRLISYFGLIDVKTYLEGDILTKVDRATMHTALEGREPLLDHKLLEFALQIPDKYKIQGKQTKYLLRQILFDYVPKELIERPKQGFSIPITDWLHSILKKDILALQNNNDFINCFQLNKAEVNSTIQNFLQHNKNPQAVWQFYVLYRWFNKWIQNNE